MNLQYLRTLPGDYSLGRFRGNLAELAFSQFEKVYRWALNFYPQDEVDKAASNRRSKTTDDAVIADFMSFEQPAHKIPKDYDFYQAITTTRELFHPGRTLYPISFPDLRYYPWNLPPNAEAPWNLPDFRFTPTFRDLDDETESPKLREHIETLSGWISDKRISVQDYLRNKHRFGLITNTFHSFHNLYNEIFQYNRSLVHFIKDGLHPFWTREGQPVPYYWNTLHARSHVVASDEPDKIRAVFGAPKLFLMVENMFIWSLQATYLNEAKGKLLWGRETIRGGWRRLFEEIHSHGEKHSFMSLDWSQFDKRLQFELIDVVHSIWKSYFQFDRYEPTSFYPNSKTNPIRIERLWKWMCHCVKHTPILLPNGQLYQWTRNGFGSGYQQTQLMDSFANTIMILTCLSALGVNVTHPSFWIRVQGDDSLIAFGERMYILYGPLFLERFADAAQFYFNAKLSSKKSQFSNRLNHMSVLGYHNTFGLPYRSDEDLLRHLMFPETPGPEEQLLARAIGLAHSACGCSERFHSLCEFIVQKLESKGRRADPRALRWMVRASILEAEEVQEMLSHPLPSRIDMRASVWVHTPRTESQKQRLWPTEPGTRNRFFFLTKHQI
jgi:hypothetical protein